jgi:hypothetical protein
MTNHWNLLAPIIREYPVATLRRRPVAGARFGGKDFANFASGFGRGAGAKKSAHKLAGAGQSLRAAGRTRSE